MTEELPTISKLLRSWYKPGSVFVPSFDFRPIIFDNSKTGVQSLTVSVVSAQSDAEKTLRLINESIHRTK